MSKEVFMWRIIFLNLLLFSTVALAQVGERSEAIKFDEFKPTSDLKFKQKINDLLAQMAEKGINYRGVVKFFGSAQQKKFRMNQYHRIMDFVCIDRSRILIIDAGVEKQSRIEFWIEPSKFESSTIQ